VATDRRTFLKATACAACQALILPAGRAFGRETFPVPGANVKEAFFYDKLGQGTVQCQTCPHACLITPGNRGRCGTKLNKDGKLFSISYGNPCTVNVDPIEKKPFSHFLPGTLAFSLAVAGCNFTCLNCQNWEISQTTPDKTRNYNLPPAQVVAQAKKYNCASIAFTYSEATTFYEYMVDTAGLAKQHGIKSVWVSNAYMKPKAVEKLCKVIDAATLNLKSFSDKTYMDLNGGHLKPVLETLEIVKQNGVWLEIINLVVPTYTDKLDEIRKMCGWILENLGPDVPLHFSRFFPKYRLVHLSPTPVEFLIKAREAARAEGLNHVYVGNVPGMGDTIRCAQCGKSVIKRRGYALLSNDIKDGKCGHCGAAVAGRWKNPKK